MHLYRGPYSQTMPTRGGSFQAKYILLRPVYMLLKHVSWVRSNMRLLGRGSLESGGDVWCKGQSLNH